jgi:hypothetical protein
MKRLVIRNHYQKSFRNILWTRRRIFAKPLEEATRKTAPKATRKTARRSHPQSRFFGCRFGCWPRAAAARRRQPVTASP